MSWYVCPYLTSNQSVAMTKLSSYSAPLLPSLNPTLVICPNTRLPPHLTPYPFVPPPPHYPPPLVPLTPLNLILCSPTSPYPPTGLDRMMVEEEGVPPALLSMSLALHPLHPGDPHTRSIRQKTDTHLLTHPFNPQPTHNAFTYLLHILLLPLSRHPLTHPIIKHFTLSPTIIFPPSVAPLLPPPFLSPLLSPAVTEAWRVWGRGWVDRDEVGVAAPERPVERLAENNEWGVDEDAGTLLMMLMLKW